MDTTVKRKHDGTVRCRCRVCGRRLGEKWVVTLDGISGLVDTVPVRIVRPLTRGPRTGVGISPEPFGGRAYYRIRCKCGRDEKLSAMKLPPVCGDELYV